MLYKLLSSIHCAFEGLVYVLKTQQNFRFEIVFAILCIVTYVNLELTLCQWVIGLLSLFVLVYAELLNTAIELLCDLISLKYNVKIKCIKDVAAGAVLVVFIMVLCTNVFIIYTNIPVR